MIEQYETIIWDWNGTILNDVSLCVDISNTVLAQNGLATLSEERYRAVFGFPIKAYYERVGLDLTRVSMEELTQQFIQLYSEGIKACTLQDGVEDLMNELQKTEKSQFILTASHTEIAEKLLRYFSLEKYFKAVYGLDNHRAESKVSRGKALIETHQIDPQKAVMIGDTLHDFEVAEAIGVACVLVAYGHQDKDRLVRGAQGKALVVEHIDELRS